MRSLMIRSLSVLALGLLAGCSGKGAAGVASLVGPGPVATVSNPETTGLATAEGADVMVPLQGKGTLAVVSTAGSVDCTAPDGAVVALFPAQFDALAQYSHFGRTVGKITSNTCQFDPSDGTLVVSGLAQQTAANGDTLQSPYTAIVRQDFSFSLDVTFAGGTGRFTGASGSAHGGGTIDLATGKGVTWLDGMISTVGIG